MAGFEQSSASAPRLVARHGPSVADAAIHDDYARAIGLAHAAAATTTGIARPITTGLARRCAAATRSPHAVRPLSGQRGRGMRRVG